MLGCEGGGREGEERGPADLGEGLADVLGAGLVHAPDVHVVEGYPLREERRVGHQRWGGGEGRGHHGRTRAKQRECVATRYQVPIGATPQEAAGEEGGGQEGGRGWPDLGSGAMGGGEAPGCYPASKDWRERDGEGGGGRRGPARLQREPWSLRRGRVEVAEACPTVSSALSSSSPAPADGASGVGTPFPGGRARRWMPGGGRGSCRSVKPKDTVTM